MSHPLRFLIPLVLSASIAGCGGGSESSGADRPPASSGTSNEQDTARVKLNQCLREQGIDVPDSDGHSVFGRLTPAERQRVEDALRGPCRKYQGEAFGDASPGQSQEFLDALTRFTACLRKKGVDIPDPDPSNPFSVLHSLDQSDPTVAAALPGCRDELQSLNGR